MGSIILLTDKQEVIEKFKNSLNEKIYNLEVVESVSEIMRGDYTDICIIDNSLVENITLLKNIRSRFENMQIILFCTDTNITPNSSNIINSYIFDFYSEDLIRSTINTSLRTKNSLDKLSEKNKNLANSLYRLNVLYNTSSQFSGTLQVKELIEYMIEGLDKSLSFDLSCTVFFENENSPILIINSLYDISEELLIELKNRTVKNYKMFFANSEIPYALKVEDLRVVKNIKNTNHKLGFNILEYDNLYASIESGEQFFGCIEIFKEKIMYL